MWCARQNDEENERDAHSTRCCVKYKHERRETAVEDGSRLAAVVFWAFPLFSSLECFQLRLMISNWIPRLSTLCPYFFFPPLTFANCSMIMTPVLWFLAASMHLFVMKMNIQTLLLLLLLSKCFFPPYSRRISIVSCVFISLVASTLAPFFVIIPFGKILDFGRSISITFSVRSLVLTRRRMSISKSPISFC